MPELPDITIYVERLNALFAGQQLTGVRLQSSFLLRSYDPPLQALVGRRFREAFRSGKQIVLRFEPEIYALLHLMIAGRLRVADSGAAIPKRGGLLGLDFQTQSVILTEVASHKRARLHVLASKEELATFDRRGLEPLTANAAEWTERLLAQNRTLKRALTDPAIISGVGNAYSDEILFRAGLSPTTWTTRLSQAEIKRLAKTAKQVLNDFTASLRAEVANGFPDKVTAFRPDMAVHGRFGQPCVTCATPIQRVRFANNELNYCPHCQTGDKLLADRSLSRLLKGDWPKTLEELEERRQLLSLPQKTSETS